MFRRSLVASRSRQLLGAWTPLTRSAGCRYSLCIPLCLLLVLPGCTTRRRAAEHMKVSGQVLYKGKPVTGGKVNFITTDGFASTGVIDPEGNYKIEAPMGDVKITVDNKMLNPSNRGAHMKQASKGAGRPDAPEPDPVKGTYVMIPTKYYNVETSSLTYTVTKGDQTHNIELTD